MMNKVEIKKINKINIPSIEKTQISSIPVFYKGGLEQPVTKVEVVFNAGDSYSENPLVAVLTNFMLLEGTKNLTSKQFAEKIDYIAADIVANSFLEHSSISLVSLNKHINTAFELLNECLNYPRFDVNDFNILKENKQKKLNIDLKNVNIVSRREFFKSLFANHPYGRIIENHHFDEVDIKQLNDFYNRLYNADNATIYLSGHINDDVLNILNKKITMSVKATKKPIIQEITSNKTENIFIEKSDAVQSAIKIGKLVVSKHHPDYIPLFITNVVLGGYFGSRLMKVLREEKGYTYGINSYIFSHKKTNVFIISTEVIAEHTKEALKYIYEEINKLCQEKITTYELENVRSYLSGQILRSLDGPLNTIEVIKGIHQSELDMNFYNNYLDWLNKITPDVILTMAQRYLSSNFLEVVVGKMN